MDNQTSLYPDYNYEAAFTLTIAAQTPYTVTRKIDYLAFCNTENADHTVTVKDGNGKTLMATVTVKALDLLTVPLPEGGLQFTNGIVLTCSVDAKVDCWLRKRS